MSVRPNVKQINDISEDLSLPSLVVISDGKIEPEKLFYHLHPGTTRLGSSPKGNISLFINLGSLSNI